MGFGLFGKLPQKRDFLALNLPNAVLHPLENWLQSAVASSRNTLGRDWERHYLVAPIWRFWLGEDLCGAAVTGALMPSVDAGGRYFPLALLYWTEAGESLAPPLVVHDEGWYAALESRLLSVLSDNEGPADPVMLLGGLPSPVQGAASGDTSPVSSLRGSFLLATRPEGSDWTELRALDGREAAKGRSYWWCSLPGQPLRMLMGAGLPHPEAFAAMISLPLATAGAEGAANQSKTTQSHSVP